MSVNINKLIETARKISLEDPGIITPLEINVLTDYLRKSPEVIAKDRGITTSSVYGVFNRLKTRRKRFQRGVNLFNNLARDKRLYSVLTPKPEPLDETEEE